jgi:hypothetical protein
MPLPECLAFNQQRTLNRCRIPSVLDTTVGERSRSQREATATLLDILAIGTVGVLNHLEPITWTAPPRREVMGTVTSLSRDQRATFTAWADALGLTVGTETVSPDGLIGLHAEGTWAATGVRIYLQATIIPPHAF